MQLEKRPYEFKTDKAMKLDQMYMNLANNMAALSTCSRMQVGAMLIVDKRPILSGYNGSPKGHEHCIDIFKRKYETFKDSSQYNGETFEEFMKSPDVKEEHGKFSRLHEVHAEINIISEAAARGLAVENGRLYITHSPCNDCCKSILTAKIAEVVFQHLYDRETEGLQILLKSGVKVYQVELENERIVKAYEFYIKG